MFYTQYIRENNQFQRIFMIYFENHRAKIEHIFQKTKYESNKRYYFENVNVLLNKNKKIKIDLILMKTTIMILMKLIYILTLLYQILRRI